MIDSVNKHDCTIYAKDDKIIIAIDRKKLDNIQESVHQAFRGVFKGAWETFEHHYEKIEEFDEVMKLARELNHIYDTYDQQQAHNAYKRWGGLD